MAFQRYAYEYWYRSDIEARAEYIFIIASSIPEADHIFKHYGYNRFFDWGRTGYQYTSDRVNKEDLGIISSYLMSEIKCKDMEDMK